MTETEKNLQDFFAAGGQKVVGAVVMWALLGVKVPRAKLREDMERIGLGAAVPKDPKPERLLAKAVQMQRLGGRPLFFRRLSKQQWALVEEERGEDGQVLAHEHTLTLGLEMVAPVNGTPRPEVSIKCAAADSSVPGPDAEGVAAAVARDFEMARRYASTEDLSQVLVAAMGGTAKNPMLGAVSLRQGTGGVYFVPGPQVDTVRQLKALVDSYGSSHLTLLTLHGDASNLAEAAHAARQSFAAQLAELQGELGQFVADMTAKGAQMTDRHAETRVNRLAVLRDRVDLWADVLGDVRQDLRGQIAAAQEAVAREMGLA